MISDSSSAFTMVFGAVPLGGNPPVLHQAREAVRSGYAVVPCLPGTKKPMCTLTSRDVKMADELAQKAAFEAGHRRAETVRHECGIKHALTELSEVNKVVPRLLKHHGTINLGLELGQSRMVVVDVDTTAEEDAFRASWLAETGQPMNIHMTVHSPGVVDDGGTWKHKDGGHYWFTLPEGINLPPADGALKDETGWVVMWADRQVLVPPSVRDEGAYELVGEVHPLPTWILKRILAHQLARKRRVAEQAEKRAQRVSSGTGQASIDAWSAATPWDELLEPDGWTNTGVADSCGCDIFKAPDDVVVHASPKSATAHDVGCSDVHYDDSDGHLPLHIWTDNPPDHLLGTKTFSKIQYVARRDYGDDSQNSVRAACRDLGIPAEGGRAAISPLEGAALRSRNGSGPPDPLAQPSETSGPALGVLGPPLMNGSTEPPSDVGPPPVPLPSAEDTLQAKLDRRVNDLLFEIEANRLVRQEQYPFATKMAASGFHCALDDYDTVMASSRQFLIAGWLPERSDIALGAEYKAGKTLISMDAAVSIASGTKFLNTFEVPRARAVAIMVGEANEKDFYQKLTAICENRGIDVYSVLPRLFIKFGAWKLDDPRMVENVHAACVRIDDLGLIIIDPWYLAAGSADGKTLSVMGDVLSNLTGLRAELNTSLMITTHWNQTGQGKGFNRWTGNGLQEWGRTLINVALDGRVEGPAPYTVDKTAATVARLSVVLKGETAGSYRATRTVHRDDALDLDTKIHYAIVAEEYAYDEDSEPTTAEKNQMALERKSDLVLLRVLQYINRHAVKPPTEDQVVQGKLGALGSGSGSKTARKAQLQIAVNEGWVEASGKMAPALKGGKIQHDPADPEKGSDTLVLTTTGQAKRKSLENPYAPFLSSVVETVDEEEA